MSFCSNLPLSKELTLPLDGIFNLNVPFEIILPRVTGRLVHPQVSGFLFAFVSLVSTSSQKVGPRLQHRVFSSQSSESRRCDRRASDSPSGRRAGSGEKPSQHLRPNDRSHSRVLFAAIWRQTSFADLRNQQRRICQSQANSNQDFREKAVKKAKSREGEIEKQKSE